MKKSFKIATISFLIAILATLVVASAAVPVNVLGTSGNFAILAKTGISTTGTTSITGDIGVSPAAATYITGFGLIMDSSTQFSTSSLVTGKVYASDYAVPTPAVMTTAVNDMQTAYTTLAGLTTPPPVVELGAGTLSGYTLVAGIYKWGTPVVITGDITLSGTSSDTWVFQIAGTLDIASGVQIILSGGAQASNIYWVVAGETTLYPSSVVYGNILDQTGIAMQSGATLYGRALAQTAVTLIGDTITEPTLVVTPYSASPTPTPTHVPCPTPTHVPCPTPTHVPCPTPTHVPCPTKQPCPIHRWC